MNCNYVIEILKIYLFPHALGTWREAIFISWGGLRGALGMALGLLVQNSGPSDMEEKTQKLFFYVGGVAALTLVINAPTSKSLLYALGLLGKE